MNADLQSLPPDVQKYSETPIFTETTVPPKLTADHNTKAGVWGKLCVLSGELEYIVSEPKQNVSVIKKGQYGIILPEQRHFVKMTQKVTFKVEFYKVPNQ